MSVMVKSKKVTKIKAWLLVKAGSEDQKVILETMEVEEHFSSEARFLVVPCELGGAVWMSFRDRGCYNESSLGKVLKKLCLEA